MLLRHWIVRGLVSGLSVALLAGLAVKTGALDAVQSRAADQVLRLAKWFPPSPPEAYPQVVIVSMDDQSMRALDVDGPWPRAYLASPSKESTSSSIFLKDSRTCRRTRSC